MTNKTKNKIVEVMSWVFAIAIILWIFGVIG